MHPRNQLVAAIVLLLGSVAAQADSRTPAPVIAGWVEKITLLPWNATVKAKLDTGARTSSIYAQNIERFKKGQEKWVRFEIVVKTVGDEVRRFAAERPLERRIAVKEHETENNSRLVVSLDFCMDGRKRSAQFSLADRGKFVYPVLLGRRFLSGIAIVDPAQTFLTQAACEN